MYWTKNRGEERRCGRSGKRVVSLKKGRPAKPESPAPPFHQVWPPPVSVAESPARPANRWEVSVALGALPVVAEVPVASTGGCDASGMVFQPFFGEENGMFFFVDEPKICFLTPPLKTHIYPHISYPSLKSYPNKKFQLQSVNSSFYGRRYVHFGLAIHPLKFKMGYPKSPTCLQELPFSKPPTFGIKTFHCVPRLIRIALSILTEEALVLVPQWLALAALGPGSSWQS